MKKIFLLFCALIFSAQAFAADKPLKVVASTTFFKSLVEHVGGEHVEVRAVASPKFNAHYIQPKPSDVARTAKADLFVFAGLDLEAWVDPLLQASGRHDLFRGQARNLDLSLGIKLLKPPAVLTRAEGDVHAFGNPHYHMNPENALIMIPRVAAKLSELDEPNAADYQKNAADFEAELRAKIHDWKNQSAAVRGSSVFSYHDEVAYFAEFLGFYDIEYLEPKPGVSPSPKHLEKLERVATEKNVKFILAASYYSRRLPEKLARKIGGAVVTIAQNPGEVKGTEDLLAFYDYNVKSLVRAV
ncbi:MAG TPA: hypothetical protein DIS66_06790 [Candidatus Omnitrophica bacterium]|nr:hypothetical protein [Candidatus Omnitrophota bacterium]